MDGRSWASLAALPMKAKGRMPAAGFLCCLLLLLSGLSVHCTRSRTSSTSSASGDNDDPVTVTVVFPELESPAFGGPEVWSPVGALRKPPQHSRNASRSFATRLIRLHVSGSTSTRELLLQLLSLHTTSDLLLQQLLLQQQQQQRQQSDVAYLLKSLEEDTAFRDIKQRMQQEVLQMQDCGLNRGNSSICTCKKKRRRFVALGASLLHAAPFLQHRAVSLLHRFRLAPVDLAAAQNGTEQEAETEKETEKKCRLDPMADGCTARDFVSFPLQLSLKRQKPATDYEVFKESLTEWQNRVALDLLTSFKFEDRSIVDLTKRAINIRVYLQTMLNMTEIFSVPPDWKLSNFLEHFAFVAVSSAASSIAYPEGVGSEQAAVTDVQNGLGVFSLKGEKLQADITMAQAAKAGILLKAPSSSRVANVLLAMSQTRIFCFHCLGGRAESRGERFVVASLLIDACGEGEEQFPTVAPWFRFREGAETKQLTEPHHDQSKYPNCQMDSFVVSGVPVETSGLSLRHFLLSSAGLSPAAGAAFYLCVGLSPVSCTPFDWEIGRHAKDLEEDSQETGGLISKLLLAAAEKQRIYLLKRPLVPLPLSAFSRAANKFFLFSVAPPPSHLEGQLMPALVAVNVQLNPLGAALSDSAKSARGVVFVAGVSEDLLQEEFLCHLASQRTQIPSQQPWKHLRLCILPRAGAAGGGGTAAATTAEKVVEGCLSGPLGSSMGEVIRMMEKTDGELYVLPKETKGPKETQEISACNDNSSPCSVVIFPQELSLNDDVFSLVIGLPSGGVFAVANIPVSATAGEVLLVIRSAVAASSETLIKFPTALTATSLILVSRDTDRAVPQDMQAWKLRGFREKEPEGDTPKSQAEDSQRQHSLVSSVMLQFKFRPLDAAGFQLRMQPLKERVLDFSSRVFSPKGAKPNKAK